MIYSSLTTVRQRLQSRDPLTLAALEQLLGEADTALALVPPSVMDKSLVPPSGDKHDYMSVGPYWWPDPEAPSGLPYIRRDGQVNPQRHSNDTDMDAFDRMADSVCTLLLAGALTEEARYGDQAATLLRTWFIAPATCMNPHLKFGQSIPGRCEGRGIGIIDTKQTVNIVRLLRLAPPAAWSDADQTALAAWLGDYVDWLLNSDLGADEQQQHNNHGTWFDAQVGWFALYAGRADVTRRIVGGVLDQRIARHIEPDGRQPHELSRTRPMGYSCFNLMGLMHLADAADEVGVDLWHASTPDGRSIETAARWLAPYASKEWERQLDVPDTREAMILPAMAWAGHRLNNPLLVDAVRNTTFPEWRRLRLHLTHPYGSETLTRTSTSSMQTP